MDSGYHRRPLSVADDESDEETNPFHNATYDPNASTDRIPLTQAVPGSRSPYIPYAASPPLHAASPPLQGESVPFTERPSSRYALSESYLPPPGSSHANLAPGFGPGSVQFPIAAGGRPLSVMSNMTEDWIQRQQPVPASQADLRRYQTRRVKLSQGNVFTADYPYIF
jgi:hypothetical protein